METMNFLKAQILQKEEITDSKIKEKVTTDWFKLAKKTIVILNIFNIVLSFFSLTMYSVLHIFSPVAMYILFSMIMVGYDHYKVDITKLTAIFGLINIILSIVFWNIR